MLWSKPSNQESFRLSQNPQDALAKQDFFRGTQVFGATGGGKTSGSGEQIAHFLMKSGFGGLVLCVKEDESLVTDRRLKKAGRHEDMRNFSVDGRFRFNFLEWILKTQPVFSASAIADLFVEIVSVASRGANNSSRDPFWSQVLSRVLTNAISLAYLGYGHLRINEIYRIVFASNAPDAPVPGVNKTGREYLDYLRRNAESRVVGKLDLVTELAISYQFLSSEFTQLADKTRSIVYTMFMNLAEQLRREPLNRLFQSETNLRPEDILNGAVVVVDIPIHRFDAIGRMANAIWKTCFKYSVERRSVWPKATRDVFLWADESQYIIDTSDARFQTTARSNRCATVYLTQNLQNYLMELHDKATVFSLMESLTLRFYHQNGDSWTNEEATRRIGKIAVQNETQTFGKSGTSKTRSEEWVNEVPTRLFTNLRSGGPENDYKVDAVLHVIGKRFSSGRTWLSVEFKQEP